MYYVYSKYVKTGRTDLLRAFDTIEDAIKHIHRCYSLDSGLDQLAEYYYYIKKH